MSYYKFTHKRLPYKYKLGQVYKMRVKFSKYYITVKLIRPTPKGFNFLNIDTHKCVLKNHLYKSKHDNHQDGLWLWTNTLYEIIEYHD